MQKKSRQNTRCIWAYHHYALSQTEYLFVLYYGAFACAATLADQDDIVCLGRTADCSPFELFFICALSAFEVEGAEANIG